MTQLGLTARLLSPVLAVACTTGVVLDVQLHDLRWQDELGGAFPLSLGINNAPKQPTLTASCAVAVAFCDFLRGPIAELITTVGLVRPVSPMIMWGNVASAANSHHTDPHAPVGPGLHGQGHRTGNVFRDPHFEAPPLLMILSDAVAAA